MLLAVEVLRACPLLETPPRLPGPDFHHPILQLGTLCSGISLPLLQVLRCLTD